MSGLRLKCLLFCQNFDILKSVLSRYQASIGPLTIKRTFFIQIRSSQKGSLITLQNRKPSIRFPKHNSGGRFDFHKPPFCLFIAQIISYRASTPKLLWKAKKKIARSEKSIAKLFWIMQFFSGAITECFPKQRLSLCQRSVIQICLQFILHYVRKFSSWRSKTIELLHTALS